MRVRAIIPAGYADTYNMEVEGTHDFVVNGGVVVHNCADEWRYVCMSRPIKPRMPKTPSKFDQGPLHQILDIDEKDMLPAPYVPRMEILS